GMTVLTRTLGANSFANVVVSTFTPAFAAAYGANPGSARSEPLEEMLMMAPPFILTICAPNNAESRNTDLRLTAMILSNNSSVVSNDEGARGDFPALLTSICAPPHFSVPSA